MNSQLIVRTYWKILKALRSLLRKIMIPIFLLGTLTHGILLLKKYQIFVMGQSFQKILKRSIAHLLVRMHCRSSRRPRQFQDLGQQLES